MGASRHTQVCAKCNPLISEALGTDESVISHGSCRRCFLLSVVSAGVANAEERQELAELLGTDKELTGLVPEHVRNEVLAIHAKAELAAGARLDLAHTVGLLLSREVNRREWEPQHPPVIKFKETEASSLGGVAP